MISHELKKLLANTYALYLKTQNYHWNVVGPQFYGLHHLFEDQYKELSDAVDEIAERIRGLNDTAPGSFEEFIAMKDIPEAKQGINAMVMVKDLQDTHEALRDKLVLILDEAKQNEDDVTQDLIIERLEAHEKAVWMLKSHLA